MESLCLRSDDLIITPLSRVEIDSRLDLEISDAKAIKRAAKKKFRFHEAAIKKVSAFIFSDLIIRVEREIDALETERNGKSSLEDERKHRTPDLSAVGTMFSSASLHDVRNKESLKIVTPMGPKPDLKLPSSRQANECVSCVSSNAATSFFDSKVDVY